MQDKLKHVIETIEVLKVRKIESLRKLEYLNAPKMAKTTKKGDNVKDKKVSSAF